MKKMNLGGKNKKKQLNLITLKMDSNKSWSGERAGELIDNRA